jgi:small subunit ribosomal protein S16
MAVKIRLARGGSKKRPYYYIVVADSRTPRDGKFLEKVGTYNPMLPKESDNRVSLKTDRVQHWLNRGAQVTDRVARFLDSLDLLKRQPKNNPEKAQAGKKRADRTSERLARQEIIAAATDLEENAA